jgi:hypothetical protein
MFSNLIAWILGFNLVANASFNVALTVVLQHALSVCCAHPCSPRAVCLNMAVSITLTCKSNVCISAHATSEIFDCLKGELPALATLPRFTGPQIIPHTRRTFLEPGTFCTTCTGHPTSICSENWTGASSDRLIFKYATESVIVYSVKFGVHFCSWTFVSHAQFHISCIPTPQQRTWNSVTNYTNCFIDRQRWVILNPCVRGAKRLCRLCFVWRALSAFHHPRWPQSWI